jgi:ABC-type multidrug transport system permease subunit
MVMVLSIMTNMTSEQKLYVKIYAEMLGALFFGIAAFGFVLFSAGETAVLSFFMIFALSAVIFDTTIIPLNDDERAMLKAAGMPVKNGWFVPLTVLLFIVSTAGFLWWRYDPIMWGPGFMLSFAIIGLCNAVIVRRRLPKVIAEWNDNAR